MRQGFSGWKEDASTSPRGRGSETDTSRVDLCGRRVLSGRGVLGGLGLVEHEMNTPLMIWLHFAILAIGALGPIVAALIGAVMGKKLTNIEVKVNGRLSAVEEENAYLKSEIAKLEALKGD